MLKTKPLLTLSVEVYWILVLASLALTVSRISRQTDLEWKAHRYPLRSVMPEASDCDTAALLPHITHSFSAQSISCRDRQLSQSRGTERESTGIMSWFIFTLHCMHSSQLAVTCTHTQMYVWIFSGIFYQHKTKEEGNSVLCACEVMQ